MKRINKTAFILYMLIFIIFPLGVLIRITPFINVNIYPQDLLVGLIFLITLIFYIKKESGYNNIFKSIFIFNVIAIISLIINSVWLSGMELLISLSYLLRLDAYFSLLFLGLFGFDNLQVKILKRTFLVSSLFVVIFGFVQFVFYNNLKNLYYLGWDEHLYRMFSTFLDPNFTGLFLALLSIFLLGGFIRVSKTAGHNFSYLIFMSFTLLALILTYSRTAIISFLLGASFLLVYLSKIKLLAVSIILLLSGVVVLSNFSIEGMNPLRIASSEARLESMGEALEIFSASPIYGVGFNTYRYAQIEKGFRNEEKSALSNADAGTDNSFLFVLATTGFIGLLAYLNIWRVIIAKIKDLEKSDKAMVFSIIAALFLGSFFINALFYMPIMLWVFVYLGFSFVNHKG